jgi:hypothetical protein
MGCVPKKRFVLSTWCNLWYDQLDSTLKSWIFFTKVCKFWRVGIFEIDSLLLRNIYLTHACKFKDENWGVYCQLDLEVISKTFKEKRTSNFEWGTSPWKMTPRKTLILECYYLMNPIEWGAEIVWGWFLTRQFQDPMVNFLILHFCFFEKRYFSNYVKNYKIFFKKC